MRYIIKDIVHSGRMGERGRPVANAEYYGLIGSVIEMDDIEKTKQFSKCHWDFIETESVYEWWDTSEVILLEKRYNKHYTLETVNTIYKIDKLDD